jgi:U3 small nucleolar RNA-associated protein 10
VQSVQDKAKLQLLLPTIQSLLVPGGVYSEELASSLVSSFNSSTSRDLNDPAKPYWKVFTDVLRKYLPLGMSHPRISPFTMSVNRPIPGPTNPISGVLAAGLLQGLFEKLDQQRKIELCDVLLEICSDHVESVSQLATLWFDLKTYFRIAYRLQGAAIDCAEGHSCHRGSPQFPVSQQQSN